MSITACTPSGGISPSKTPITYFPFLGSGTGDEDETVAEIVMESCDGVYELYPVTIPGNFYYPEVLYGNTNRSVQYFHCSGSDRFYLPIARNIEHGTDYTLAAVSISDGSYLGESAVIGQQHYLHKLEFGVLFDDPCLLIGIAAQEEHGTLTFCIQDDSGNIRKTSETIKSPPDQSGYHTYLLDEHWMLAAGRSSTSFYMVSTELQIMGPYDIFSPIKTGYTREDGRVLLISENGRGYQFDPARDTVTEQPYYTPSEAQRTAVNILCGTDGVYFIGREGITVQRADGEELQICDFSKSYLSQEQIRFCKAITGDRFLVFFRDPLTGEQYPALLSPTEETERPVKTVIRAVSIGSEPMTQSHGQYQLIQNLVTQFNRTNETYQIEVTVTTAEVLEDALLRGEQYDLYLFGEDNAEVAALLKKLEDKALFANLTGFMGKQDLLDVVENVAVRNQTGEISLLPLAIRMSTLAATEQTIPAGTPFTYETLFSILENLGSDESLFSEYIQRDLEALSIYDFVDMEARESSFDSPLFGAVLSFLSDYEAACFDGGTNLMTAPVSAYYNNTEGKLISGNSIQLHGNLLSAFADGDIKFLSLQINTPGMIPALQYLFRQYDIEVILCGYPSADGGTVRVMTDLSAAVGRDTEYSDGVYAFLRLFLSDTVQTSDALSAFPVTKSAVDAMIGYGYQYLFVDTVPFPAKTYGWDSYLSVGYDRYSRFALSDLTGREQTEISKAEFDAMMNHFIYAKPRGGTDTVIRDIVAEEMSYVTQGVRSTAEAAKMIDSRVWIYLNE